MRRLIGNVQKAMREHGMIDKLKFLLYGSGPLSSTVKRQIESDDAAIVWL